MAHPRYLHSLLVAVTIWLPASGLAQQATVSAPAGVLGKGAESQFAPAQAMAVAEKLPSGEVQMVALRGLLVSTGTGWLCYDTGLPGVVAEWTEAKLDLSKTNFATYKGLETGAVVVSGQRK